MMRCHRVWGSVGVTPLVSFLLDAWRDRLVCSGERSV